MRRPQTYSVPDEVIAQVAARAKALELSASDVATALLRAGAGLPDEVIHALAEKSKPGPKARRTKNQQMVLDVLARGPWEKDERMSMSLREIRDVCGLGKAAIQRALFELVRDGLVFDNGEMEVKMPGSTLEIVERCWKLLKSA